MFFVWFGSRRNSWSIPLLMPKVEPLTTVGEGEPLLSYLPPAEYCRASTLGALRNRKVSTSAQVLPITRRAFTPFPFPCPAAYSVPRIRKQNVGTTALVSLMSGNDNHQLVDAGVSLEEVEYLGTADLRTTCLYDRRQK